MLRFVPSPPELFAIFGRTSFKPSSIFVASDFGGGRTSVWREIWPEGGDRRQHVVHDVLDVPFDAFTLQIADVDGQVIVPGVWLSNDYLGLDVTIGPESERGTILRRGTTEIPLPCTTAALAEALNSRIMALHAADVARYQRRIPKRGPNGRFVAR